MSLPPWNAVHSLVVHFPIALLSVALVFVVLWMFRPEAWRLFGMTALLLMLGGTIGATVATLTGEASADKVEDHLSAPAHDMLEEHSELGETTRNLFIALTVAYVIVLMMPRWVGRRLTPASMRLVILLYVAAYALACGVLARTGHAGGRLVHEFDTHVEWPAGPTPPHQQE